MILSPGTCLMCRPTSLLGLFPLAACLQILELDVPTVIDIRESAELRCRYELEGDQLYSVKWYKEELEFFRFMPNNKHQTFQVHGIHVSGTKSNGTKLTLAPLEYRSAGVYKCEVSTEKPRFQTVFKSANMTVLGLPQEDPKIRGLHQTYSLGDVVDVNCTSAPSHPPADVFWFVNQIQARSWAVNVLSTEKSVNTLQLESRTLNLKLQIDTSHYRSGAQTVELQCRSTVAGRTRSKTVRIPLTKLQTINEKFAQEQLNNKGGRNFREERYRQLMVLHFWNAALVLCMHC